jgi:hypothetical protein
MDKEEKYVGPLGEEWDEFERKIFTPEEIAASDSRVKHMVAVMKNRADREGRNYRSIENVERKLAEKARQQTEKQTAERRNTKSRNTVPKPAIA